MGKIIDLTGQKFGRLTVIKFDGINKHKKARWRCVCQCGKECTALGSELRGRHTVSCGCWNKERKVTHGEGKTRLYRIWADIKTRCLNKTCKEYKDYGGRGITLCAEWIHFETFKHWAVNNGYNDSLTIDRIDNNASYSPTNCRWATVKEQNRNQRSNRVIQGKCLAEWAEISGINYNTLRHRLRKGWPFEKAVSTPTLKHTRLVVEQEMEE